jgi:hypothetical protein
MEQKMTVTVSQILQDLYPELPEDDNTYRLFKLDPSFNFGKLTERDLTNHKNLNSFTEGDKLVVVQNSEIIYIEE